jgi:hypothetical protein
MYKVTMIIANNIHESHTRFVGLISLAASEWLVSATTAERSSNEIKTAVINKNAKM